MSEEKDNYKGKKFKTGKYCGFRKDNQCNSYCGLFNVGLGGCVLHSMNMNLQELTLKLVEIKDKLGKMGDICGKQ